MNATVLDLRKNMKRILAAIDRNQRVTLTYRGHIAERAALPSYFSANAHSVVLNGYAI